MRRKLDIGIAIVKAAVCGGMATVAFQWHLVLHRWAGDLPVFAVHLPFWDLLLVIGTLTACSAIVLLSRDNARRVATNASIIVACTIAGLLFGDPSCRGSYDHGGGETLMACLTFGILGTLIGWYWTIARSGWGSKRGKAEQ